MLNEIILFTVLNIIYNLCVGAASSKAAPGGTHNLSTQLLPSSLKTTRELNKHG